MRYAAVILFIISFYSCDDTSTGSIDRDTSIIMPLNVGNSWIYKTGHYDTLTNKWDSFDYDTVTIVGDTTIGRERWANIDNKYFLLNRTDGLWTFNKQNPKQLFMIKFPARAGEIYNLDPQNPNAQQSSVAAVDTIIQLPSGNRHSCNKYSTPTGIHFYKPGYGRILSRYNDITEELVAYHLR